MEENEQDITLKKIESDLREFENKEEFEPFDWFRYSLWRAWALLALQDFLDAFIELDGNMTDYMKNAPIPGFHELFGMMEEVMDSLSDELKEKMNSFEIEGEELSEKMKDVDENEVYNYFKPFMEFMVSLKLVSERPLYHEAVVSAVTAFETYLKGTLIDLISGFPKIEKRFTKELKKGLSYDKILDMDYERDKVLGYVVAESIKFYEMEKVNEAFRRAFGIKEKNWTLFSSKDARKELQKFMWIRHLIVHNGGYVDSKFKKKTNCNENIGEEYHIEREYIENMMNEMLYVTSKIEEEIKRIEMEEMGADQ